MHTDWKGPFRRRLQKIASERGKRMAAVRWQRDRERRRQLATLTAEKHPSEIVLRVVVIRNEREVSEATIWSFDSTRSARRKLRAVLAA